MITSPKLNENLNNGLTDDQNERVIQCLMNALADQHVLYMKLRNFHWNMKGGRFFTLHELFEQQYTALAAAIDETAERIRMLGGTSPGSMAEFMELSSLKESAGAIISCEEAITTIVADHETMIRDLRKAAAEIEEDYKDQATADFFIELLQAHEKQAWMLRSCMEG